MTAAGGHLTPDTSDTVIPSLPPPTHTSAPPCPPGWKSPDLVAWPLPSPLGVAGTPAVLSKAQPNSTELSLSRGYLGPS